MEKRNSQLERIVREIISGMSPGVEFCAYDIAIKASEHSRGKRDRKTEQCFRQLLSKLLPEMDREGEIRFLGEETGTAPHKKKLYKVCGKPEKRRLGGGVKV